MILILKSLTSTDTQSLKNVRCYRFGTNLSKYCVHHVLSIFKCEEMPRSHSAGLKISFQDRIPQEVLIIGDECLSEIHLIRCIKSSGSGLNAIQPKWTWREELHEHVAEGGSLAFLCAERLLLLFVKRELVLTQPLLLEQHPGCYGVFSTVDSPLKT